MKKGLLRARCVHSNKWVYGIPVFKFQIGYSSQGYDDVPERFWYMRTSDSWVDIDINTLCKHHKKLSKISGFKTYKKITL